MRWLLGISFLISLVGCRANGTQPSSSPVSSGTGLDRRFIGLWIVDKDDRTGLHNLLIEFRADGTFTETMDDKDRNPRSPTREAYAEGKWSSANNQLSLTYLRSPMMDKIVDKVKAAYKEETGKEPPAGQTLDKNAPPNPFDMFQSSYIGTTSTLGATFTGPDSFIWIEPVTHLVIDFHRANPDGSPKPASPPPLAQ